jgi:hypothetical protein
MYGIQYQLREGRIGDFILMGGWNDDGSAMTGPTLRIRAQKVEDGYYQYRESATEILASDQVDDNQRIRQIHWSGHDPGWINLKGYRGRADLERPVGEWNTVEIIVRSDTIVYKINGTVINVGTAPSVTNGKILIQSEYSEIYFRRLDLVPLVPD